MRLHRRKELPVPFLDAKALETDPHGMAFLRSVIRPDFEREPDAGACPPLPRKEPEPFEPGPQGVADPPRIRPESVAAAPAA